MGLLLDERTGRPLGDRGFIEEIEKIAGRRLKIRKPGPKPKAKKLSMVSPEFAGGSTGKAIIFLPSFRGVVDEN